MSRRNSREKKCGAIRRYRRTPRPFSQNSTGVLGRGAGTTLFQKGFPAFAFCLCLVLAALLLTACSGCANVAQYREIDAVTGAAVRVHEVAMNRAGNAEFALPDGTTAKISSGENSALRNLLNLPADLLKLATLGLVKD